MYSYLKDDNIEKKRYRHEKYVKKLVLEFEEYESCQEAIWLKHKINYLGKNNTDINSLKVVQKEFFKGNRNILKC